MRVAIVYGILALVSTGANIAAQDLCIRAYSGPGGVVASVALGTVVGLLAKYVLDKRFIFGFKARDRLHDGQTFLLYALMGVFTTAIFWGFEFGFHLIYGSKALRYLGGMLGLLLGYWVKYHLDRRYVFRPAAS